MLQQIITNKIAKNEPVHLALIELKKVYDFVPPNEKDLLLRCSTSQLLFKILMELTLKPWKWKSEAMGVPIKNDYRYTLSFTRNLTPI